MQTMLPTNVAVSGTGLDSLLLQGLSRPPVALNKKGRTGKGNNKKTATSCQNNAKPPHTSMLINRLSFPDNGGWMRFFFFFAHAKNQPSNEIFQLQQQVRLSLGTSHSFKIFKIRVVASSQSSKRSKSRNPCLHSNERAIVYVFEGQLHRVQQFSIKFV